MSELHPEEIEFMHTCARDGPTGVSTAVAEVLERRGYVKFVYEGRSLQGKWRLTDPGRVVLEAAQGPTIHR
jgi:hypothetical protein